MDVFMYAGHVDDLPYVRHSSDHVWNGWIGKYVNMRSSLITNAQGVNSIHSSESIDKKQLENLREGLCLENSERGIEGNNEIEEVGRKQSRETFKEVTVQSHREVRALVSLERAVVEVQTRLSSAPKRGRQMTKGNNRRFFLKDW